MVERHGAEHEIILDIEGMTCASCVHRLERVLQSESSVTAARVSLASRTAAVRTTTADLAPLIEAVVKAGYGARPRETDVAPKKDPATSLVRLGVSAFLSFDVLVFSLIVAPGSLASKIAAWLLATPVQFYGGWPFLRAAALAARRGTHTMDTLIAGGSLAAYLYSVGATFGGSHHAYFDTASMIVTLILLGRVLESKARRRAGDAARSLLQRQPKEATVLVDGEELQMAVVNLSPGDRVVVLPGQAIPADGIVRDGRSSVDVSMLTGESVPIDVAPGDEVVGGTLNCHGRLEVELERVGSATRLAAIVRLLEVTQASKAPIQRLADRVAAVFVPRVMILSGVVFFGLWYLLAHSPGEALMRAAAVLLVACPCSLGLATPIAIMTGSGRAAERNILFKGGEVFELARRIDTVLIDKTGTLTEGSLSVASIVAVGAVEDEVLALAAAVERGSEHPIGRSVVRAAEERGLPIPEAVDFAAEPGAGISARVGGSTVRVGRPSGLSVDLTARVEEMGALGLTPFVVWRDGRIVGLLGAADTLKPAAAEVVRRLRAWGIDVALVSGDQRGAVEEVARRVGIERAVAGAFPEDKIEEVRRLQTAGRRVAFVGDGVNDAPALAQADLGIALSSGADVAAEAGNVLILGTDLRSVAEALELARRTFWVIAQNLTWAFAYNALMIPLAAAGRVSPLTAAGAMAGSSLTVVANALRLRRYTGGGAHLELPAPQSAEPAHEAAAERPDAQILASWPLEPRVKEPIRGSNEGAPEQLPLSAFAKEEGRRLIRVLGHLGAKQWEY